MVEFDTGKDVYLFLHGRMDLKEKATTALVSKGFSEDKITMALPTKVGQVGDYMALSAKERGWVVYVVDCK